MKRSNEEINRKTTIGRDSKIPCCHCGTVVSLSISDLLFIYLILSPSNFLCAAPPALLLP